MDQCEMKKVFHGIRQRMSTVDAAGLRTSRRIEGLYASDREAQGFPNMLIYLDQGVGVNQVEIADILYDIDRYLGGYNGDQRMRYLFSFGDSGGRLVRHAHAALRWMSREQWQQWTESIANAKVASSPTVPELFVGQKFGSKPCPSKRDLLIYFSRSRQISMPEQVLRQYYGLKRNALWFFFDAGRVEWEIGKFVPCSYETEESRS